MSSNNKIAVIYDTNNFFPSENKVFDLTQLNFEKYYKLKKTLRINGLENKVELFFPEIVLLELIQHHELRLKKELQKVKELNEKFNNFPNITIKGFDEINVKKFCEELKQYYIEELKIIPIPENKIKLFDDILEMAINKYPPFIKKNKNNKTSSDKGFKDAIIFLSLLEFKKETNYDEYIIVSDDEGFDKGKEVLKKKFNIKHLGNLEIIKNDKLSEYINNKYELFKDLRQYILDEFIDTIFDEYERNKHVNIDNDNLIIRDYSFIKDYMQINQLNAEEFELEILFLVSIDCRTKDCYFRGEEIIPQKEKYLFKKNNDQWECKSTQRRYELIK